MLLIGPLKRCADGPHLHNAAAWAKPRMKGARRTGLFLAIALVATAVTVVMLRQPSSDSAAERRVDRDGYRVGAYYYTWYLPQHWKEYGYLGPHLEPLLEPQLGEYESDDPQVIGTHIRWAAQYGIEFFIISWSYRGSFADDAARKHLLPALAASTVRQAPMIELIAYGEQNLRDGTFRQRLGEDLEFVATNYLKHPSALRVNGRPVLFLYTTRVIPGDVSIWMTDVRARLAGLGVNAFIVADEAFWQPADPMRLRAFDAVTAYNVYEWPRVHHGGWASTSMFFTEVEGLFARWQAASRAAGVAFVPNAMPGYNDRGVRLEQGHYVIPRAMQAGASATGFFERSLDLARRYTDPALRMVTITSFNEWHEWTQIEPTRPSGRSPAGDVGTYTQGFPHQNYGLEYLELLHDKLGGAAVVQNP
jgi:glycoprotein endo-alpha-1,2-mannosidase